MPDDPSTPPSPWTEGQAIGATRLNAGESSTIRSIQVAPGTGLKIIRVGANVVIALADNSAAKQPSVPLLLTTNIADADGFFESKRFAPPTLPDKSGPVAESDLGIKAATADAIAVCVPALGNNYALGQLIAFDAFGSGKPIYAINLANTIEVDLYNPAGSAGVDQVSVCNRTYSAKIAGTDIVVGVGLSPTFSPFRSLKLALNVAAQGRGCFVSGAFQLRVADESVANQKICT